MTSSSLTQSHASLRALKSHRGSPTHPDRSSIGTSAMRTSSTIPSFVAATPGLNTPTTFSQFSDGGVSAGRSKQRVKRREIFINDGLHIGFRFHSPSFRRATGTPFENNPRSRRKQSVLLLFKRSTAESFG